MEKQDIINRKSATSVQYAYIHEDKEGRWHAYGESAHLLRRTLRETLVETNVPAYRARFEPVIDQVELDFAKLLLCNIVLCSDTTLVIECPLELLCQAS